MRKRSRGGVDGAIHDAAKIAIREVSAFLKTHPEMEVTFCCFSKGDVEVYERLTQDNQ